MKEHLCCSTCVSVKDVDVKDVSDIVKQTVDWLRNYFSVGRARNLPTICILSNSKLGNHSLLSSDVSVNCKIYSVFSSATGLHWLDVIFLYTSGMQKLSVGPKLNDRRRCFKTLNRFFKCNDSQFSRV